MRRGWGKGVSFQLSSFKLFSSHPSKISTRMRFGMGGTLTPFMLPSMRSNQQLIRTTKKQVVVNFKGNSEVSQLICLLFFLLFHFLFPLLVLLVLGQGAKKVAGPRSRGIEEVMAGKLTKNYSLTANPAEPGNQSSKANFSHNFRTVQCYKLLKQKVIKRNHWG